ncbi:MAG: hypothetical protein AMXMBFR6_08390 [Betaproteobacteria bacterium]
MSSASAVSLVVGGRQLTIEPVRVRDLAAFVAAVAPIASDLAAGEMLEALSRHTDRLIDATAIGAGVERAWLDARGADDLVELAAAVMEVNGDFFTRRLLPAIERAAASVARAASRPSSMTGPSPSAPPASTTVP